MTAFALVDSEILFAGARLTCQANTFQLSMEERTQDATVFCSGGWSEQVDTIASWSLSAGGFSDSTSVAGVEQLSWAELGATPNAVSVVPSGGAAGAIAYTSTGRLSGLTPLGGAVGDLAAASWDIAGSARLRRGVLMSRAIATVATVTGTAFQLGAVTAGQQVVLSIHAIETTGSWVVRLDRDNAVGMPSPTTVLTSSAITGTQGVVLSSAAVTTDDWWRVVITRSSGTGTFLVVAAIG